MWEFENRLKKVQQDSKQIKKTQKNLTSIEEVYQKVETRIGELKVSQAAVEKDGVALEQRLRGLSDGVRTELDRFGLEKRGLSSVNEEVTAIRNTLSTFEQRLHELEGSSRALVEAQSRADELMAECATVYNSHVGPGKLTGWSWLEHQVGGEYRRLLAMRGADHKAVLAAWGAIVDELDEKHDAASTEFSEICYTHQDYMWDIVH